MWVAKESPSTNCHGKTRGPEEEDQEVVASSYSSRRSAEEEEDGPYPYYFIGSPADWTNLETKAQVNGPGMRQVIPHGGFPCVTCEDMAAFMRQEALSENAVEFALEPLRFPEELGVEKRRWSSYLAMADGLKVWQFVCNANEAEASAFYSAQEAEGQLLTGAQLDAFYALRRNVIGDRFIPSSIDVLLFPTHDSDGLWGLYIAVRDVGSSSDTLVQFNVYHVGGRSSQTDEYALHLLFNAPHAMHARGSLPCVLGRAQELDVDFDGAAASSGLFVVAYCESVLRNLRAMKKRAGEVIAKDQLELWLRAVDPSKVLASRARLVAAIEKKQDEVSRYTIDLSSLRM